MLQEPSASDELGELSHELDRAGVRHEPMSDSEGLRPQLVTSGRPLRPAVTRGRDDERLDLAALARGSAGSESQRPLELAPPPALRMDPDELPVVPGSRRPWGNLLLLALGVALGFGGALFVISSNREKPAPSAAAAPSAAPAPSPPAAPPSTAAIPVAPAPNTPAVPIEPSLAAEPAAAAVAPVPAPNVDPEPVAAAAPPLPAAPAHRARHRSPPRSASAAMSASSPSPVAVAMTPPSSEPSTPVLLVRPSEPESSAPKPASPAKKKGSLDSLLDDALSPEARRAESARGAQPKAAPASTQLAETPTRDEVSQAMAPLLPRLNGCAMGQTGVANASLTVRNDGKVATAQVTSAPFAGTASGRCMEGVLRRAAFPRFRKPLFSVRYPFQIK